MSVQTAGGRLLGVACVTVVLAVFEIALVGKIDPQETLVGAGVALLVAAAVACALAVARLRYAFRVSWLWLVLLVLRNVVRDTFVVFGVLLRRLAGGRVEDAYQDVPFDPGGDDAASAARRALAVAAISTSPNEIALEFDRERGRLRVHALAVTRAPRHSLEWPL